jgi:hypothetical protein
MARWIVFGEPVRRTTYLIVPGPTRHERRAVQDLFNSAWTNPARAPCGAGGLMLNNSFPIS